MLISYPILPAGADASDENTRLNNFLTTYVDSATGFYPVSFEDRWHGGIHLLPGNEPLRAIADGEVVCYRVAAQPENYPGLGDYDTSFVLLKHTTESGENTPVVFYSLLMHLKGRSKQSTQEQNLLPKWLRETTPGDAVQPGGGHKVWRKDVLGFGGVYAGSERVHFEIFATNGDFGHFWKDSSALAAGGTGSDDFFGDMGFIIPSGKNFLANHPHAQAIHGLLANPAEAPVAGSNNDVATQAPALVPVDPSLAPAGVAGQIQSGDLYVSVRLSHGNRIATSYHKLPSGKFLQVGDPVTQSEYEYQLYQLANKLYSDCPSAGYEWLRFGRVLGSDTTHTNENFQLIRYDTHKIGYIDLGASDVTKLSDADFPIWQGWQKIAQGQAINPQSSICDVPALLELLHGSTPPATPPSLDDQKKDFIAHATSQGVADQLRYIVVQHPSEWDDSDLETRFAKERQTGGDLADPNSWNDFTTHVKKMAFWSSANLDRSVWHFHPIQFVAHYRKCEWRSLNEIAQLIPRNPGSGAQPIIWSEARNTRFQNYKNINKTWRKYVFNTPNRQASFIAQSYTETALLTTMEEFGKGHTKLYGAFYGRGMMQLTWASNFEDYGKFRNFSNNTSGTYVDPRITSTSNHEWSAPVTDQHGVVHHTIKVWSPRYDPDNVASDDFNACDSAGFYWVSKHFLGHLNIHREADEGLDTVHVGHINVLVNGGGNGYENRIRNTPYAHRVLSDDTDTSLSQRIQYREQSIATVNHHTTWQEGAAGTTTVDFTPQRPS